MTNLPKLFNLSTRSHYSCGFAIGTPKEFIEKAKEKGLSGITITDRNTFSGALDFYKKGKELNFPVALGLETFFIDNENNKVRIILIAKNQNGYFNLCKVASNAWENEPTYKEPCISTYHLFELKDDLYCLCDNVDKHLELFPIFQKNLFYELILSERNINKNKAILDFKSSDNSFSVLQTSISG